jgi:RNA polymerase sigma factor (sigma-70 family)
MLSTREERAALKGAMSDGGYDERFEELAGIAYRVAYRMVGSREDARDLAQEAMARAFAHWRRASHHPEAWVSRVTANLGIDLLRRRGRLHPDAPVPSADHGALTVERIELVRALASGKVGQRQVVVMRYLADLPEAQVARELGCSTGSVKQHASRGLAALRTALAQPVPVPVPLEDR